MAQYDGNDEDLLAPIQGDKDANDFAQIDPVGNAVFGWGSKAWNDEINQREAEIAKRKASIDQEMLENARKTSGLNDEQWAALQQQIFGSNGQKLADTYSGIEGKDTAALGSLQDALGSYKNSADYFNDPNFMGDVGDVTNQATPDASTVAAQKGALQQLGNLTTPQETAQEKLIRLMGQREAEQNERGDREAMAERLKARGVYGSGAELASALGSQETNAVSRSLAAAQAAAGASQRAMAALGKYSDVAGAMRGQELQQGSLANQVAEFNNSQNQAAANARAQAQVQATQQGEAAKASRAQQGFNASTAVNNAARGDTTSQANIGLGVTSGATQGRTADNSVLNNALGTTKDSLAQRAAELEAQKKSTGLLGGIF